MRANTLLKLATVLLLVTSFCVADDDEDDQEKKSFSDRIGGSVSAIGKASSNIAGKVGGVASKVNDSLDGIKAPGSVAVLPASGEGSLEEQNEVRIAIHNSLGGTNISSLKPSEVDRLLVVAETTKGMAWRDVPQAELARLMAVDGLLYVEVDKLNRLYAGAYAHYEVGVALKLYSLETDSFIWEQVEEKAQRKGGVSVNPLGMLATAVSSARILTDAVRQVLVNTVARKLAEAIPQPSTLLRSKKPVVIDMAVSNGVEGPFSVGDEITVIVQAEPSLVMFFDIAGLANKLPMEEKEPGEYLGRYVVAEGDDAKNLFATINATRVRDKQNLEWRVPGMMEVDTVPPGDVLAFGARSMSEGVALSWNAPLNEDASQLEYVLERADVTEGTYTALTSVAINEYIDTEALEGQAYYYRIRASDKAKNEGSTITTKVTVFKPGPTLLSGLLEGDIAYPSVGNPYQITGPVTIASNANISFEAGTILELESNQTLNVQGKLIFNGSDESNAAIRGDGWKIVFDGANASGSALKHTRITAQNGEIVLMGAELDIASVNMEGTTVIIENRSVLDIVDSEMVNADPAIRVVSGQAAIDSTLFSDNLTALVTLDPNAQQSVQLNEVTFLRNQTIFRTQNPYEISGAAFGGASLTEIQSALDGPVRLNLHEMAGSDTLVRDWLAPNMSRLQAVAADKQWLEVAKLAEEINIMMPSAGIQRLVRTLMGDAAAPSADTSSVVLVPGKSIWIQSETLPELQAQSEELALRAVVKKLNKQYLKAQFPSKRGIEITKLSRGLQIESAIEQSIYLYAIDKGLLSEVWVAHILNDAVVNSQLASAGLGANAGSKLQYAVSIENNMASNILLDVFEAQKVRYTLGTGASATPYRVVADVLINDTQSAISSNLNVAEVTLRLRIERVGSNDVVGNWKAVGSSSAFSQSDARKKALQLAMKKIESLFMRKLWQLDSAPVGISTPVAVAG